MLNLLITAVLILGNAFFVGSEFALIASSRTVIEPMAAGSRRARLALSAMNQIPLMIAGAQLGITICSLGLGAIAEPAIAHLLESPIHAVGLPEAAAGDIVRELMRAAGAGGMIGGQLLDLQAEGVALPLNELERVHRAKTGALITAAARIGAMGAGADKRSLAALARYGSAIGLAFQIMDDVLDVTSTTDELGKTAGRDAELHKSTYPALLGTDGARRRADALIDDATSALRDAGILTPSLDSIARYVVARRS